MSAQKQATKSLTEYMREKARAGCVVCQLSVEIRAQLGRAASKRGFTRPDQVEWLRTACGATKVTVELLNSHLSAKHDNEEDLCNA